MTLKEYALACVEAICQQRIDQYKHPVVASLNDITERSTTRCRQHWRSWP